jgi:hypothetical protein
MRLIAEYIKKYGLPSGKATKTEDGLPKPSTYSASGDTTKMKKGGYVKAADGCCQRGKTRGTMK